MSEVPKVLVRDLIESLKRMPQDLKVVVWMPGQRVRLCGKAWKDESTQSVFVEGNVEPAWQLADD